MKWENVENLLKEIHFRKGYCVLLKKRLHLIKKDYSSKDEFQRNEVDIATAETNLIINEETNKYERLEKILYSELNIFYQQQRDAN